MEDGDEQRHTLKDRQQSITPNKLEAAKAQMMLQMDMFNMTMCHDSDLRRGTDLDSAHKDVALFAAAERAVEPPSVESIFTAGRFKRCMYSSTYCH